MAIRKTQTNQLLNSDRKTLVDTRLLDRIKEVQKDDTL